MCRLLKIQSVELNSSSLLYIGMILCGVIVSQDRCDSFLFYILILNILTPIDVSVFITFRRNE